MLCFYKSLFFFCYLIKYIYLNTLKKKSVSFSSKTSVEIFGKKTISKLAKNSPFCTSISVPVNSVYQNTFCSLSYDPETAIKMANSCAKNQKNTPSKNLIKKLRMLRSGYRKIQLRL